MFAIHTDAALFYQVWLNSGGEFSLIVSDTLELKDIS